MKIFNKFVKLLLKYFPLWLFLVFSIIFVTKYIQKTFILNNPINKTYDVKKKQECISNKGQWVTDGQGWWCNNYYKDGGKECKNGNECLSEKCLAKEGSKETKGTCSQYFVVPGCFDLLSGQGKHTGFSCATEFLKIEPQ